MKWALVFACALFASALSLDPIAVSAQVAPKVGAPEIEAVARELMDPCENCKGKLLSGCDCEPAAKLKEEIRARLQRGETKEEIVAATVAQYGEWIRSAPPKSGFNLVGWGMPFALIGVGVVGIALYLRRAVRRRAPSTSQPTPQPTPQPMPLLAATPTTLASSALGGLPAESSPEWDRRLASELDRFNR